MKPVRLAITGSAGVGKTTLAETLGARLDLPVVEEGMRARIREGLDLHTVTKEEFRGLILELFHEMFDGERNGGYVADRSPADYIAFWLYYGLAEDQHATDKLFELASQATAGLDAVILLPWGSIPLVDDGVRAINPWWQLHYHALLDGLLSAHFPAAPVWRLPEEVAALSAREDWVIERLATAGILPGR